MRTVEVGREDEGIRLDRWFRRHYPDIPHGRIQKWLRTGQIRIDGRRAKANARLVAGQKLRLPPVGERKPLAERRGREVSRAEAARLRAAVIHRDAEVIAINKPPGLAVQGGTGTIRHLDAMLDELRFGLPERPRLVHRLDKDTSGVLLLGRSRQAAAWLTAAFRRRDARKVYWALVAGVPKPRRGRIDLPLAKRAGLHGERVAADRGAGRRAVTLYAVIEAAGQKAAWLALMPLTGRTHQLRVHCAAIGTPIVGDGKYGGAKAFLPGAAIPKKLHLHAREVVIRNPAGKVLKVTAPLPDHMRKTWALLGFDPDYSGDPFAEAGF